MVNLTTGVSFGVASSFATGNTIEAVVAVWLLKRFLPEDAFRGARDAFVFFLIAITSCVPAATVGALSMLLGGRIGADAFGANWITWLLGDLAGEVIIFPIIAGTRSETLDANDRCSSLRTPAAFRFAGGA